MGFRSSPVFFIKIELSNKRSTDKVNRGQLRARAEARRKIPVNTPLKVHVCGNRGDACAPDLREPRGKQIVQPDLISLALRRFAVIKRGLTHCAVDYCWV